MSALQTPTGSLLKCILMTTLPLVGGEIYLPTDPGEARTPETRTLTAEEEARALERDWLFQAMGEPLPQRVTKEIAWTRELAARLARKSPAPDLSAELRALDALDKRMGGVAARVAAAPSEMPGWIWYPEGKPRENAPAAARFFRTKFEVPAGVSWALLRVAADDDACEVFLNGIRVGAHDTWARAASFPVENQLKPGTNVLAVRAENKPANSNNPAKDELLLMQTYIHQPGSETFVRTQGDQQTNVVENVDSKTQLQMAASTDNSNEQAMFFRTRSGQNGWDSWWFYHDGTYYQYVLSGPRGNWTAVTLLTSPSLKEPAIEEKAN